MSIWTEAGNIISAILSQDSFEMKTAFRTDGMWLLMLFVTVCGGFLVHFIYKAVPFLERQLERGVTVITYLIIAGIIFWGVIDRFVFSSQVPWSTTIPPLLFMVMAWFGCSYNVKLRTHLSFSEFRTKLSPTGQMAALSVDAILWLGFCWVVITTTLRVTANSAANFQIVFGTDSVMQWWYILTVPFAFTLMSGRVIGNWLEDWKNYRLGNQLIKQAVIGGDA